MGKDDLTTSCLSLMAVWQEVKHSSVIFLNVSELRLQIQQITNDIVMFMYFTKQNIFIGGRMSQFIIIPFLAFQISTWKPKERMFLKAWNIKCFKERYKALWEFELESLREWVLGEVQSYLSCVKEVEKVWGVNSNPPKPSADSPTQETSWEWVYLSKSKNNTLKNQTPLLAKNIIRKELCKGCSNNHL